MPFRSDFLSWGHREQDAPEKNKKRQQRRMQVQQELYRKHQICKKAQQDVGLFYLKKYVKSLNYDHFLTSHNVYYINFRKI